MSWPVVPLGDIALSVRNGIFARRPTDTPGGSRILRISAVRDGRVNLDDAKWVTGLDPSHLERFSLNKDDLLLTRYNGSRSLVGISGIVPPLDRTTIHPDKLIRVVIDRRKADPRFVNYQLNSPLVRAHIEPRIRTTAGQSGISGIDVKSVPIVLPPLDEQRRIIDILEDQLSQLDAANDELSRAAAKLVLLRERTMMDALIGAAFPDRSDASLLPSAGTADGILPVLPRGWSWSRLGDVADVVGGVTKDAKKQSDPTYVEVPYLRVANVQRGHLALNDVANIRVPPTKADVLRLEPGDVLLNEGGDRDKLARGWVWEGQIENCIHQNHVFRARIHEPRLDPYFLSMTANTMGGRWAERNGKQSVNLASISLGVIRKMPVIVPAAGEAERIVTSIREMQSGYDRIAAAMDEARARSSLLRKSLLTAAFSGRLTRDRQHLDTEELVSQ